MTPIIIDADASLADSKAPPRRSAADHITVPYTIKGLPQAKPAHQLIQAQLTAARFEHVSLDALAFDGALLTEASFSECSLINARYVLAILRNAWFLSCVLKHADFRGADLTGTRLHRCVLTKATLTGASGTDVELLAADADRLQARYTTLPGLRAMASRLIAADFTGSDLAGADFSGADLTHAILAGADLRGTDFSGADLTGANLTGALIDEHTCFTGAVLEGARQIDMQSSQLPQQLRGAMQVERFSRSDVMLHERRMQTQRHKEQKAADIIHKYELAGFFSADPRSGLLSEQLEALLADTSALHHPEIRELFEKIRSEYDAPLVLRKAPDKTTAANEPRDAALITVFQRQA